MTKQDELLSVTTDTNALLKQQNRSLELLVNTLVKAQETQPAPQKIGFIQNAVNGIIENPKTSIAGISSVVLSISTKFFPQYAEIINSCIVGVSGSGLLLAKDSKPAPAPAPAPAPRQNEELLG